MMDLSKQVDEFRQALQTAGTPERAQHERAYLKSNLRFYGTGVPAIRQMAKGYRKANPDLSRENMLSLVKLLWQTNEHEMRSLALGLLDEYGHHLGAEDGLLFEEILHKANTWAHVDWLSTGAISQWLNRYPDQGFVLNRWIEDHNFWVRRAALLALIDGAKTSEEGFTHFARLAAQCLDETEFFIRKAIAWVLRTVSKKHPDWVYMFLSTHINRVSGLTLREGGKYLPTDLRDELMQRHSSQRRNAGSPSQHNRITTGFDRIS